MNNNNNEIIGENNNFEIEKKTETIGFDNVDTHSDFVAPMPNLETVVFNNVISNSDFVAPTSNSEIIDFDSVVSNLDFAKQTPKTETIGFDNVELKPEFVAPAQNLETIAFGDIISNSDVVTPTPNLEPASFDTNMVSNNQTEEVSENVTEQSVGGVNKTVLENLVQDTNELINPDMINPLKKPKEEVKLIQEEEPKVDYDKIATKKNYILLAVIVGIIIVFIIFLPNIVSLIGL